MDAIELLAGRRSVSARLLGPPAPEGETLDQLLRLALRVPDHGRLEPWRIKLIRSEGQASLGALVEDLYHRDHPDADAATLAFERNRPQRAPLLIAVVSCPVTHPRIPAFEQLMSAAAVCYGAVLAARALGFSATWLTEWFAYRPEVVAALGHDPDRERIAGFVHVGTPVAVPAERPRPELSRIASLWPPPTAG